MKDQKSMFKRKRGEKSKNGGDCREKLNNGFLKVMVN